MTRVTRLRRSATPESSSAWRERSGRLYEELQRPAQVLVRRAFRGAFGDDEIEDIYSNAWLGTLRALELRHERLTDEEVRKYLLTAVAHHASKELRRRSRKPTAPLDEVAVPDEGAPPEERAAKLEDSQLTRDLLVSLPPRRRAVMLLRYGWGLEPTQVCGLVKGLSLRAYRKEITRGVDELTEKLSLAERGEWCSDREPVLKAYASGLADAEQQRQAQQHLSHCRHCTDFVGKLTGHLHDLGASLTVPSAVDALQDGRLSLPDHVVDAVRRIRESASSAFGGRSSGDATESAAQAVATSGGARGAGAAGTGVLAKLAGVGTAGKLAVVCLGGSAAATACLAAGIVPGQLPGSGSVEPKRAATASSGPAAPPLTPGPPVTDFRPDAQPEAQSPDPPAEAEPPPEPSPPPTTTTTTTTPVVQTTTTAIAPTAPPQQQEFGVASAAPDTSASSSSSATGGGGGSDSAVMQEFGP